MAIGRPQKKTTERRDNQLGIRLNDAEMKKLELAATADQRSLSDWARLQLLKAAESSSTSK